MEQEITAEVQEEETVIEVEIEEQVVNVSAIGEQGPAGNDGVGISSITLTSTVGKVKTYTITFTNGNTTTFQVSDGNDGTNGTNGTNGDDGKSLEFNWRGTELGIRVEGSSQYTYVDLKGATGNTGATGNSGVYIGSTAPTDPSVNVWIDPSGSPDNTVYSSTITTITKLTQAQYNSLSTKDNNTLYIIVG